jgi:hypothetical protein
MMLTALLLCLIGALQFRPSSAGAAYVVLSIAFDYFSDVLPDNYYYLIAALTDLLIIIVIYMCRPTRRAVRLMTLSSMSIALNCAGWVMLNAGQVPFVYNVLSYALYGAAIYVICTRDECDVETDRVSRIRTIFCCNDDSSKINAQGREKAI